MPLGIYGSTLNDELNRLANGGTYPDLEDYLDQAGAAQAWAASESVALGTVTDLVGVLNYINGVTDRSLMLDIAGVCNSIAGTTGLEPAAALRQVEGEPAPYPGVELYVVDYFGYETFATDPYLYTIVLSDSSQKNYGDTLTSVALPIVGFINQAEPGVIRPNDYYSPPVPSDLAVMTLITYTCPMGGTYNPATGLCEY